MDKDMVKLGQESRDHNGRLAKSQVGKTASRKISSGKSSSV